MKTLTKRTARPDIQWHQATNIRTTPFLTGPSRHKCKSWQRQRCTQWPLPLTFSWFLRLGGGPCSRMYCARADLPLPFAKKKPCDTSRKQRINNPALSSTIPHITPLISPPPSDRHRIAASDFVKHTHTHLARKTCFLTSRLPTHCCHLHSPSTRLRATIRPHTHDRACRRSKTYRQHIVFGGRPQTMALDNRTR